MKPEIRKVAMLQESRKQEMSMQLPVLCQFKGLDDVWGTIKTPPPFSTTENGNILLFMDNAPCHPDNLQGKFENIKIVFLPKNTTSKTQPLDAGIIGNWKVHYKKRLLRYICGKVTSSSSASEIVKSVNLLMVIEWGKQAWDEVSDTTSPSALRRQDFMLTRRILMKTRLKGRNFRISASFWIGLTHHARHKNALPRKMK